MSEFFIYEIVWHSNEVFGYILINDDAQKGVFKCIFLCS